MIVYLLTFCRAAVTMLFAYSFATKVGELPQFAQTISNFKLLPKHWSQRIARFFLTVELAIVMLLVIGGSLMPLAFGLALLLLVVFTIALISVLARHIQTACNCFGSSQKSVTYADVWRNVGLSSVIAVGWWTALQPQDGGIASQNWGISWGNLMGEGNSLNIILIVNSILIWLVLLFIILFMFVLAKRIRQLGKKPLKEHLLQEAMQRQGEIAPSFEAENMAGELVTLDTFKGTPVAFIFLSPSCPPCVEKIPDLNSYYSQGKANGMEMVIVNVDEHISAEAFARQHGVQPPVLWAPQVSNPFAHNYDADATPAFCLVDAAQRIQASGFLDSRYWTEQLTLMKS